MSATAELEPLLVSVSDVTRLTGICKSSIYELVRDGKLKPAKYGTKTLFSYAEVRRFADSILAQREADQLQAAARSAEARRRAKLNATKPNNAEWKAT